MIVDKKLHSISPISYLRHRVLCLCVRDADGAFGLARLDGGLDLGRRGGARGELAHRGVDGVGGERPLKRTARRARGRRAELAAGVERGDSRDVSEEGRRYHDEAGVVVHRKGARRGRGGR